MAKHTEHSHNSRKNEGLRVLVDLDGVLSDFDGYFLRRWREENPDEKFVPLEERRNLYVGPEYEKIVPNARERIMGLINSEQFYYNLPPVPNAIDALKEMSGMDGVDVMICSSPILAAKGCVQQKMDWVETHLGRNWMERLVITKDKTIVKGHILIDDNPHISGRECPPPWDHILFSCCHNLHYNIDDLNATHRLDNWTDGAWKDIITKYKMKLSLDLQSLT